MTPTEKANRAKAVMGDPIFEEAFAEIRMRLVSSLETLPIGDKDTQHEVALMLQLLKRLREQLTRYADDELVELHKQKQAAFIEKQRQKLRP